MPSRRFLRLTRTLDQGHVSRFSACKMWEKSDEVKIGSYDYFVRR
jgi:hypothetical protein